MLLKFFISLFLIACLSFPSWAARNLSGTNPKLENTSVANIDTTTLTVAVAVNMDTEPTGSFYVVFEGADLGANINHWSIQIADDGGTIKWKFFRRWTTSSGIWFVDSPAVAATTDYNVVITYDGGATGNDPRIWVNGTEETFTETSTPSGSLDTGTDHILLGVDTFDDGDLDGTVAEAAFWGRELSDDEAVAISKGFSPLCIQRDLRFYAPLIRSLNDRVQGLALSATNAAVTNHPRMFYCQ